MHTVRIFRPCTQKATHIAAAATRYVGALLLAPSHRSRSYPAHRTRIPQSHTLHSSRCTVHQRHPQVTAGPCAPAPSILSLLPRPHPPAPAAAPQSTAGDLSRLFPCCSWRPPRNPRYRYRPAVRSREEDLPWLSARCSNRSASHFRTSHCCPRSSGPRGWFVCSMHSVPRSRWLSHGAP